MKEPWSAVPIFHRWVARGRAILALSYKGKGSGADKDQTANF